MSIPDLFKSASSCRLMVSFTGIFRLRSALKESGYESDSTLVFRRREDISPLSLLEQRLAYKTVQSGGDVPLHGLRKPAPERPKGESPRASCCMRFDLSFVTLLFFIRFDMLYNQHAHQHRPCNLSLLLACG